MYYSNYYLAHHGIVGMHWGVRRYQNNDGSLTSAGKARYGTPGGAKDIKKSLTRMDKDSAEAQYGYKTNEIKRQKFVDKASRAEKHGNMERAKEYTDKAKQAEKDRDRSYKKAKELDKRINDTVNKAMKDGYDITMTKCLRTPSAIKGKRAASYALTAVGGVSLGLLVPGAPMWVGAAVGGTTGAALSTGGAVKYSKHGQASPLSEGFKYNVRPGSGNVTIKRDKMTWGKNTYRRGD